MYVRSSNFGNSPSIHVIVFTGDDSLAANYSRIDAYPITFVGSQNGPAYPPALGALSRELIEV